MTKLGLVTASLIKNIDAVFPFQVDNLGVWGHFVCLGNAVKPLLHGGHYLHAVAVLLRKTVVLTSIFADPLKYDAVFSLQIEGNGPISLMVADAASEGALQAYTSFEERPLEKAIKKTDGSLTHLVGVGHMAFTLDLGPLANRCQTRTPTTTPYADGSII